MDRSSGVSSQRVGGIAGLVFAIGMLVLGFVVWFDQPAFTDSLADIGEHFADKEDVLPIADWLAALFFVGGFLLFASALRTALRNSDEDGTWSRASFAGAVVAVAVAASGVYLSVFTLGGLDELSEGVVRAFLRADALTYSALLPWAFALFLVGACMVMMRDGAFPKWFAWLGFGAAAANVVGALWPIDGDPEGALAVVGMIGFFATLLWVVLVASSMVRRA